jgi:hypothetical protein
MIQLVERKNIDDKKWNGCVHFAENDFAYAYTWYLDNIADNWFGLIWGDYEMVMPLIWNKKYGIEYLYQPFFTQQLGIFCPKKPGEETIRKFLNAIPSRFKFIEINLNYLNKVEANGFETTERRNLVLNLERTYTEIQQRYSDNLKRNLKKARQSKLHIHTHIKPEKLVDFYAQQTGRKIKEWQPKLKHVLHRIIYNSLHYSMGLLCAVYNEQGKIIAVNFFLYSKKRIINLLPAASEDGKKTHAMSYLLDYIIQTHCNKQMVLDFEGSNIESVARFYRSFGAEEQNYFLLKRNTLPWFVKIFKR